MSTQAEFQTLKQHLQNVIVGQEALLDKMIIALLTGGHILLEGPPGLAKTTAVKTLANGVHASFQRIQFTPDLMPGDVVGSEVLDMNTGALSFVKGPIFNEIVLADEINRAPPKVQSALLEAMAEKQVTAGGQTRSLPELFLVMATQNPLEQSGTYPLPEAQLDRFLLKMKMGYPEPEEEMEVLHRAQKNPPIDELESVMTLEELRYIQGEVKDVLVDDTIKKYIVEIANRTRIHANVYLGASPRGSIALMKACQAYAFLRGRDYVVPDDVQYLAPFVFSHRIIMKSEARYEGITPEEVVERVMARIPVPVQRLVR